MLQLLPPKGAIVQVGSKFDVRPSVRPWCHAHFLDLENPYLVPESAFVLVHFWVILAQRVMWDTPLNL